MTSRLICMLTFALALPTGTSRASDPAAIALMHDVSARADSGNQQARLKFTLTDKSGAEQVREATAYRAVDAQSRRLAIAFDSPAAIRGSSFLAWDARDPAVTDDQWIYMPALRRARRIPGRDRGDYFLGTDLSYDDIRSFGRIEVAEYRLAPPRQVVGDATSVDIEGEPASPDLAKEMGYGRVRWRVDTDRGIVMRSEHWDLQGAPLKTIEYGELQMADGVWFPRRINVVNQKTGHRTELRFSEVDNRAHFDPVRLTPAGLERGG